MASTFGHQLQIVIDWVRGKERAEPDPFARDRREARQAIVPSNELERLFYAHNGRFALKWHHYLEIYERHFGCYREPRSKPVKIIELGVADGGSLQIWRKYFGRNAVIVGIDIDPTCVDRVDADTSVVIGDQSDPSVLAAALAQVGGEVDIVIDDGSHIGRHQIATFEFLYKHLSAEGLYVCEDLQYGYDAEFEGGYQRRGTFIEYTKELIDRLHAWHLPEEQSRASMDFARKTYGIFVYLDVIVIEKRPIERPFHVRIGG